MIYSRQYSRQIIVLKSIDLTKANGRCVIEIKNSSARLIVNTYNLQAENIYGIYFVMKGRNNIAVKMGDLIPDRQKSILFSPDGIEGNKLEDVSAVAIVKNGSKTPVLAGYTDDYVDLKGGIETDAKSADISENKSIKDIDIKIASVPEKSAKPSDASLKENESSKSSDFKKMPPRIDFMEMFNKFRRDMEELEKMAFSAEPPKQNSEKRVYESQENEDISKASDESKEIPEDAEISEDAKGSFKNSSKNAENETKKETDKGSDEQPDGENIFKKPPIELLNCSDYIKTAKAPVKPFENKTGGINWYDIMPSRLASIEEAPIQIILSPYVISAYKKYGHIILGTYNENGKEKYIVGVPCEESDKIKTNYFKQFIPSGGTGFSGYRLCYL